MRLNNSKCALLALAVSLSIISSSYIRVSSAEGNVVSKGIGGLVGAATGAVQGGIAGASAGANAGANAGAEAAANAIDATANIGASQSDGGAAPASLSASGSASSGQGSISAAASASISLPSTTTPKPEGLLGKMKEIFKESKEIVKSTIGVKSDEKKPSIAVSASGSISSGSGSTSSASASASLSSSQGSSPGSDSPKSGGLMDKLTDKAKDIKEKFEEKKETLKEKFQESQQQTGADAKNESEGADSALDKVAKVVGKGAEMVKETIHKIEDTASEVNNKVGQAIEENIIKPVQSVGESGSSDAEGKMTAQAEYIQSLKGADRDKYLAMLKKKQESEVKRPSSLKEIIAEAKAKGVIPKTEDRSVLKGNHADERSLAVEVFDKAHELSKIPATKVLRPFDKILGYEKDPIIRLYDNSHELLRKPLHFVAKPIENFFTGAFKTSDESKKEHEKYLSTTSKQARAEAKKKADKAKMANRSITGDIADKTVELATKPIEIVLKPLDHLLGYDKEDNKNPLLKLLDEIYSLSKRPVDAVAKPFENILKKMADGGHSYQVSVRVNGKDNVDPKLFTRLADGALNIADRIITKPFEVVMKPLNHALGYDEPGKTNPILEAAHQLKNATRVGIELFTKPLDRIVKEIAEIGEIKNEEEREAAFQLKRREASRIVRVLDKIHEAAQAPFEIVLRPVGKALGITKEGKKEPLLRVWDVIHEVVTTPLQIISKPVEDVILGEQAPRKHPPIKGSKATANASFGGFKAGLSISAGEKSQKRNYFVDGIKKIERLATKPIEVVTLPIRRLILGEDDVKVGSDLDKNNREIQSKIKGGNSQQSEKSGAKQPDKIMSTLEKMNNVMLKPLEIVTQPISDALASDSGDKKGKGLKVSASVSNSSSNSQQSKGSLSASASLKVPSISASASAQVKKN